MTDKNRLDPEIASIIENYRPDQYDDVIAEKEEREFVYHLSSLRRSLLCWFPFDPAWQVLEPGSHDMFLGEVVSVMVREDLLDARGSLHLEKAGLIAYSHGLYQKLGDVLGFFGWSVAREDVFQRRMSAYR